MYDRNVRTCQIERMVITISLLYIKKLILLYSRDICKLYLCSSYFLSINKFLFHLKNMEMQNLYEQKSHTYTQKLRLALHPFRPFQSSLLISHTANNGRVNEFRFSQVNNNKSCPLWHLLFFAPYYIYQILYLLLTYNIIVI